MVIIDEILVKFNNQRDKCYSFTTNYNQELKYFTAVYPIMQQTGTDISF